MVDFLKKNGEGLIGVEEVQFKEMFRSYFTCQYSDKEKIGIKSLG